MLETSTHYPPTHPQGSCPDLEVKVTSARHGEEENILSFPPPPPTHTASHLR